MPTYDYKCEQCEHIFEAFHGMQENPVLRCPECGGRTKRQISGGAGLIFKGDGFYATDSKPSNRSACGRETRCCGRDQPCGTPPCQE